MPQSLNTVLNNSIEKAVEAAVVDPTNALKQSDASAIEYNIKRGIATSPTVQHATNNEQWFQSRVTLGSVTAILSGIYGLLPLFGVEVDAEQARKLTAAALALVSIGGGSFALYGRWRARKPIGVS